MNNQANGSDSEHFKKRRQHSESGAAAVREGGSSPDPVTMEVKLPSSSENGDDVGKARVMRVEVPGSEAADPSAIGAAVAESLRGFHSDPGGHDGRASGVPDRGNLSNTRSGGGSEYWPPRSGGGYDSGEEFMPEEAPSIGRELSLRDIFFMVRERWILGLSVGLLLAGGLAYWMMSRPPVFESQAELLVELKEQKILPIDALEEDASTRTTLEQVMQVHTKSLLSPAFRAYVEARLAGRVEEGANDETNSIFKGFRDYESFKEAYVAGLIRRHLRGREATPEALAKLPSRDELFLEHFYRQNKGALDVGSNKRSQFITVSFRHPDPNVARQVVHAFVESYDPFLGQKERESSAGANEFLREAVENLRSQIVEQERVVHRYRQKHKIFETEEGDGSRATEKVDTLAGTVIASDIELRDMELQLAAIDNIDPNNVLKLSRLPVISEFGLVSTVRENLELNSEELSQLELRYLERHPKIAQNKTKRESLLIQLRDNVELAVDDYRARVVAKRQVHGELRAQLTSAEDATLTDNDPMVDLRVMLGNLEILRANHQDMRDRLNETEIAVRMDRTNVDIMSPAILPEFPVDPNPKKVLALAGLVLLGGLFGLPVGLGFLDTRLKSFSESEAFLGIECLGCVAERPKLSHMELGQCVLAERDEQVTEGFRVIYGSVELHSRVGFPKVFVTTSTGPGEGKSFITANLAATFARHGKRVLIVDCDLRKPSQHKLIGAKNDAGLLKWFKDGGHAPETAKELVDDPALGFVPLSEEHDIFLLRAGGSTRNPSEVITSSAFYDLVQGLRNWFDVIMLDSPPVGLFPDAMFLANHADEALFVCKHNGLNRHKIKFALKKLQGSNAEVLGTVMNQLSASRRHQYGYGYKDYGYGSYSYKEYAKYYSNEDD